MCKTLAEWTTTRDDSTRVASLLGLASGRNWNDRRNADVFLNPTGRNATVFDNNAYDLLTGSQGQDWFLAQLNGDDGAVKDKITDLSASEFAGDLDFILA